MTDSAGVVDPLEPTDHRLGPADAAVTLVEYGDFESPACGTAYVELERLRDRFDRDLAVVYRHFPQMDRNPRAMAAALASEAAADAGQFTSGPVTELHPLAGPHRDLRQPVAEGESRDVVQAVRLVGRYRGQGADPRRARRRRLRAHRGG